MTERLVAKEWNKVPQETYNAKSSRVALGRRAADTRRRPTMNDLKQGVFRKSFIITKSSYDGVDGE